MSSKNIVVTGAREHNLKNISVELPRDKLVVLTGLSGSGKSSLAFDTIYAEGQRRYVESLSSYARMFLGQMEKPDVDNIDGLSPAISIDQKTTSKNPRSTVGTVTEIYDYLRLLYARVGVPHCPVCGREIRQQTIDQIVDQVLALPERTKIQVLAPVVRGRKGEHQKEFEAARKGGFVRVRADGRIYDLSETIKLEKNKKHNIEIVVDRLVIKPDIRSRLADSLETAAGLSGGIVIVNVIDGEDILFSQNYACPEHGVSIEELSPRMFSFNNPAGACPKCTGLGVFMRIDPALIIPDDRLSISKGGAQGRRLGDPDGQHDRRDVHARARRALPLFARYADPRAAAGNRRHSAVRHEGREDHGAPQERVRQRHLPDGVRGHHQQPRAPLPRHVLLVDQGGDRVVHERRAVRRLPRQAPFAGKPCGDGRRQEHQRAVRHVGRRRARLHRESRAFRAGSGDRRGDFEGDPLAARLPAQRRPRVPDALPRGGDAFGRREPAHPPRDATSARR